MTDHADVIQEYLAREDKHSPFGVKRLAAVESAAHWLVSNRGHRGEEQAWRLLEEALGIHPPALRDDEEGKHNR